MAGGIVGARPDLVVRFFAEGTPAESAPRLIQQLADGLGRVHLHLDPKAGGKLNEAGTEFGTVTTGHTGSLLDLEMRPVNWADSPEAVLRIRVDAAGTGSEVHVEVYGWKQVLEATGGTLSDWMTSGLLPSVFRQLAPGELGEWVMDQQARRPAGASAIATYRDSTYHVPNFLLILERTRLTRNDRLLEVGCGGGAFLKKALESECSATGVDHSPEMVRLAREANRAAIDRGRLSVLEGDAGELPVKDNSFSACVCTTAFSFFPDPARALREMYRSLEGGGRLAIFLDTAAARGTPAAPEPFASRDRFYEPDELTGLVRAAGFSDVEVEEPNLLPYAKAAGLPDEVVRVFDGTGGCMLLLARKPLAKAGGSSPANGTPE